MLNVREIIVKDRLAIAITSMSRFDDTLYMGLTGGSNTLATYDTITGEMNVIEGIFPWISDRSYCTKIHNAIGWMSDGSLLLGEGNHFTWDGIPVTVNYFNRELPESMLARKKQYYPDVQYTDFCLPNLKNWNRKKSDPGGKIIKYNPKLGTTSIVAELPEFLYVQSMIVDTQRDRAFGHTIPDNHFFYYNGKTNQLIDYGHISDYAHHNMVITPNGICYGGWIDRADGSLKLLKFDPEKEQVEYLDNTILKDPGSKIAGNQGIDEWIVTKDGEIYVGMVANALFFRFDWKHETFELIGRLDPGGRITSIDEDDDGNLLIGSGYPHMSLYKYYRNSNGQNVENLGQVNNTHSRCYFHGSCYHKGKLYLGETDGFSPSLHIVDL